MRRPLGWLLAAALVSSALALGARARLVALERGEPERRELLYLPNGKFLRTASLGQSSLLASLVYLWAIQYYADYDRADRYRFVEHVFGEVIAELDPHYVDPYWIGALILSVEAQDLEAALRLLEKGFENNPDRWILPYLAGWECERAGDSARAARWFDRAAAIPGAPPQVLRLRAAMVARAGDLDEALRRWSEILEDPRADATSRAIAERQVRGLRVRIDLERINHAIEAFRERAGRLPRSLDELVREGFLPAVPVDPDGTPYAYDRGSGRASSAASRVLGGGA